MNISLTPELEKYIEKRVASGSYKTSSEYIREILRTQIERDREREEVRQKIQHGLDQAKAGMLIDGPKAMDEIMEELKKRKRTKPI